MALSDRALADRLAEPALVDVGLREQRIDLLDQGRELGVVGGEELDLAEAGLEPLREESLILESFS